MRKYATLIPASCFATLILVQACGHSDSVSNEPQDDFVAQYRDSVLRLSDILKQLPPDISSADSTSLIKAIADNWIDGLLIEDLAAGQIDDLDQINQLTARYRRSLIADSYRRKMREKGVQPVDMDSVHVYYRRNASSLKLERPIVKGLYIKVPATSRHLSEIRSWMQNPSPESYDALETTGLAEAVQYEYFADKWIEFDYLAGEIPFRFGNADNFVTDNTDFETEWNGMVYILHIGDHRTSGQQMPEEYAAPLIEDRMKSSNLALYEAGLVKVLRKMAIEKDLLKETDISDLISSRQ